MIALGCALVLVGISNRLIQGLFLLLAWLVASTFNAYMGSFVMGVPLAAMYARRSTWAWPNGTICLIVPALVFVFGYHENLISGIPKVAMHFSIPWPRKIRRCFASCCIRSAPPLRCCCSFTSRWSNVSCPERSEGSLALCLFPSI
jgi:hypothetical protein